VLEQRVEPDRRRLDIELQRLAARDTRDELAEGMRDLGPLRVGHDERVLRRHAQEAHQRPLARHQHTGAVERLDGEQLAGLRQRPLPSG
jgi:hypothetical protein